MIDRRTATNIARAHTSRMRIGRRRDLILQEDKTIETSFGWVFFYNSRRYLENGDNRFAAIGNSPLMVDRRDGSLLFAGTARPIDFYIREYEAQITGKARESQAQEATRAVKLGNGIR